MQDTSKAIIPAWRVILRATLVAPQDTLAATMPTLADFLKMLALLTWDTPAIALALQTTSAVMAEMVLDMQPTTMAAPQDTLATKAGVAQDTPAA